jgi:electron transfer flavoprotein alpha subunit
VILALIEHDRGTLNNTSLEMLTLGHQLAGKLDAPLEAVIIGEEARPSTQQVNTQGISRIHLVTHERLQDYAPEAWAQSIVYLIQTLQPMIVMAAGTDRGNEVLAHVAARTELPFSANCVDVNPGEPFQLTRMRWGGSLLEEAILHEKPRLFTVAVHAFAVDENPIHTGMVVMEVTPPLADIDFRVQVTDRALSLSEGVSLSDARVVIGGGRGVGSSEGFEFLDELASLLEGAVGSSRAATNLGWRPHADQIGQTGTRIAPDLYIACGISGAIQHMVGCKGAKRILAINTDPEAPIMTKADYAVIGDLHAVVPALIAEIRKTIGH